jgi:hypothetical protein
MPQKYKKSTGFYNCEKIAFVLSQVKIQLTQNPPYLSLENQFANLERFTKGKGRAAFNWK